ncbi:MAG: VPDSG-CTERM sorting domain-containing protein [Verrucomicrobia bacterium]|nr:VPDSG-CTERM sorting domain-containing protein [Verrucomicrobiota bacterium]
MKTNRPTSTTPIRLLGLCVAAAGLLMLGSTARADYIVTLQQVGPNVVATGSGAIDLTPLTFVGSETAKALLVPIDGVINTGPATDQPIDAYSGLLGPAAFGTGNGGVANIGSGDIVGVHNFLFKLFLFVPQGYVSGTPLSDSSTYDNATFASLGVTPGTYEWTWGTGANQNFTLQIGTSRVPDSGSTLVLLGASLLGLFLVRDFFSNRLTS